MCEFDCMYVQVDDIIVRNDMGNDRVTGVSYEFFCRGSVVWRKSIGVLPTALW